MNATLLLVANVFGCGAVFFTGYCRVVLMDRMTRVDVRSTVILSMIAAVALAMGPFIPDWNVGLSWPQVGFVYAVFALQVVGSRLWNTGAPEQFRRRNQD